MFGPFIKPGIQERGAECRECREHGECPLEFRGISYRIPGNVLLLAFRGMLEKIPGNVIKDSGECSRKFRGMLLKIPGNVPEDSRNAIKDSVECATRFRGMFRKVPGNAFNFKLIKPTFYRDLALLYLMKQ